MTGAEQRRAELAVRLQAVLDRIAAGCAAVGRDPAQVTLVAVTKTWPVQDVRLLAELGVRDLGESRDQEAAPKARACADLDLRWHFVGQLQRNKAPSVAGYVAVVHSVDRPELVAALSRAVARGVAPAVARRGRPLTCLVQVRLDQGAGRGGAPPEAVPDLADRLAAAEGLVLGGVMGVAPLGGDQAAAFRRLAEVAERVRERHPQARILSAGMSPDLEAALAAGATHVRVGTALLGNRPPRR